MGIGLLLGVPVASILNGPCPEGLEKRRNLFSLDHRHNSLSLSLTLYVKSEMDRLFEEVNLHCSCGGSHFRPSKYGLVQSKPFVFLLMLISSAVNLGNERWNDPNQFKTDLLTVI